MRSRILGTMVMFACMLGWIALGQAAAQTKAVRDVTVRGKIVKLEGPDRFVVQTSDNREVILVANPQTRYVINGKSSRYADLQVGTEISAGYVVRDERNLVNSVTVGAATDAPPVEGNIVRGRIARVRGEQIVIRSDAGKEVVLVTNDKTRVMLKGKAARIADLRLGLDVSVSYVENDRRLVAETVTVGESTYGDPTPAGNGTVLEGTVVRVVGDDQVVIRGANKKEVIVYVNPTTKYVFEKQPGRFTDIRSGADIRIEYDVRDRRNWARSIVGVRRNKK